MFSASPAVLSFASSESSFSISSLGKMALPFFTCSPFIMSNANASSQTASEYHNPICFLISLEVVCINGSMRIDIILMASARLCITVSSSALRSGSFAKAHGIFSSIYLLARLTNIHISSKAMLNENLSICSSTLDAAPIATALRSSSVESDVLAAGTYPPQYFSIMDTVLDTRLPRSLAKS